MTDWRTLYRDTAAELDRARDTSARLERPLGNAASSKDNAP